jgi:hypothetical protein
LAAAEAILLLPPRRYISGDGNVISALAHPGIVGGALILLDKEGWGEKRYIQSAVPLPEDVFCNTKCLALAEAHG